MANYKNMKYPTFLLFSVCMSLDAFGATATLNSAEEEKEVRQSKRVCVAPPTDESGLQDLKDQIQIMLIHKTQVLGEVLPEARKNLSSIEQALLGKIRGLRRETDFKRIGELAALVSSVAVLDGSSQNILATATKERHSDNDLAMAGIAVAASGALKEQFSQLTSILADSEDTKGIDRRVLEETIKAIHEITKDIYNAPME